MKLDHYTLRTRKPEETVRFYTEYLGLKEGWRPGFNFPGHWLYIGDIPTVHIVTITDDESALRGYVGERKAREMLYTCRLYSAREALEMGLINQVCPADKLDEEVAKLCEDILDKSPQSIRIAKLALNAGSDQEFYASFFPTSELLASIYGNEENMEGITAFLEKRPPNFRRFRRR